MPIRASIETQSIQALPTENEFQNTIESLKTFANKISSTKTNNLYATKLQKISKSFKDDWRAEKEQMKKRKEYTKQLMNNLKEKDQMMEDSMFQKHITMEEQLRVKKYEKEKQDKKDRKKKELEEQFEKQNSEITQALVTILKKSYKEVEVRYAEGEE